MQLDEKITREAWHSNLENEEKINHINYLQNHDFFT
jgi:hypothetical protein